MQQVKEATSTQIVEANKEAPIILVLKKKNPPKHVTWDNAVIDNEFMNKKKSKKCCIYHKPRRWDESDTDESSAEAPDPIKHKTKQNTNVSTQTQTQTITQTETKKEKHVKWTPDTIDNEFMNKKKSNKCCIYHKPRRWDESDTESDSSSDYHRDPNYTKPPDIEAINDDDTDNNKVTSSVTKTCGKMTSNQSKSEKL